MLFLLLLAGIATIFVKIARTVTHTQSHVKAIFASKVQVNHVLLTRIVMQARVYDNPSE